MLRWLCVDRAVARHFQVAARKLAQHDTYRLIEDEQGVSATDKCPVADVAIRIGAMLSLLSDMQLLERVEKAHRCRDDIAAWYREQVDRLAGIEG